MQNKSIPSSEVNSYYTDNARFDEDDYDDDQEYQDDEVPGDLNEFMTQSMMDTNIAPNYEELEAKYKLLNWFNDMKKYINLQVEVLQS